MLPALTLSCLKLVETIWNLGTASGLDFFGDQQEMSHPKTSGLDWNKDYSNSVHGLESLFQCKISFAWTNYWCLQLILKTPSAQVTLSLVACSCVAHVNCSGCGDLLPHVWDGSFHRNRTEPKYWRSMVNETKKCKIVMDPRLCMEFGASSRKVMLLYILCGTKGLYLSCVICIIYHTWIGIHTWTEYNNLLYVI